MAVRHFDVCDADCAEHIGRDLSDRPITALANAGATVLFEILCPFCWEALGLLYLVGLWTSP